MAELAEEGISLIIRCSIKVIVDAKLAALDMEKTARKVTVPIILRLPNHHPA